MAAGIDTFTFADLADADRDLLGSRPRKRTHSILVVANRALIARMWGEETKSA
jgi:hypothetical protein